MKPWSIFRCVAVFVCCAAGLRAQNSTWTGLGLTNIEWSDSLNWDTPPTTSSTVFFSNILPVTSDIDSNTTVANVIIEGSAAGTLDLTSTGNFTLNAGIYYETLDAATISVAIVNPGNSVFVNGGTLTLSNANNMTGQIVDISGTLVDGVAGSYSTTGGLQVDSPGVIDVNFNESAGYLSNYVGSGGSVVIASGVTLSLLNNYTTTFSGVVSGLGGIEKGANSTMTLTGANTYTGATVIDAGATIQLGNGGTTGSLSPSTVVFGAGTLSFDLIGSPPPVLEPLTGALSVVLQSGSGTVQLGGPNTYTGSTTVNGGTLQAGGTNAFGHSTVSIANGGTLDLNGFSTTVATLNSAAGGNLTLGAGTLTLDGVSGTSVINGVVGGAGGRLTANSYQVVLTNANTYTGQTEVMSGTLEADNTTGFANGTGTAQILIDGGGTLQIGNGDAKGILNPSSPIVDNGKVAFFRDTTPNTLSNNITGSGVLEMAGFGVQTLAGSNTFSGETEMFRGTLQAGAGATSAFGGTGNSAVNFDGVGSTLDLNNNNETVGSLQGGTTGDFVTLGTGTLTLADTSANFAFGGVISGLGGLTVGMNQLALTGTNTYSGTTTINSGATLQIGNGGTTGSIGSGSVTGSGTLQIDLTSNINLANSLTGTFSLTSQGADTITLTGNNTSYAGQIQLFNGGGLTQGGPLGFGSGGVSVALFHTTAVNLGNFNTSLAALIALNDTNYTLNLGTATLTLTGGSQFNGSIFGVGGISVNMASAFLGVGGNNTYTGSTNVLQGGLQDFAADSFAPQSVVFLGGTTSPSLFVNYNEVIGGLADLGGHHGVVNVQPGATLTIANVSPFTTTSSLTGTGGITIAGSSTETFGGSLSVYYGLTTVNSGTLQDGAPASFSPNSAMRVNSGGSLVVNASETVADLESTSPGGSVNIMPSGTLTSLGSNYVSDFQGVISGGGEFIVGGGVQGLSGNNTYSGGTLVNAGELFVGSDTALGTNTAFFNVGTEFSPDADVTLANSIVLSNGENLENDDGGNFNMTLTGVISESGGVGSIQWCTPGTLTLTNANSFTGGVDMREGNLVLGNNAAAGSGMITLSNNTSLNVMSGVTTSNPLNFTGASAVLTGSGTIATPVIVDGSAILSPAASPGNGPGTLTFSNGLTLATGGQINFNLYDATGAAGTGYSLVSAPGGLNITAAGSTFEINVSSINASGAYAPAINFNAGSPYSWTLVSASSISGYNINDFVFLHTNFQNSIGAGFFTLSQSGNNILIDFIPVPEPSTWCLIGAGALVLVPRALRRRRTARA